MHHFKLKFAPHLEVTEVNILRSFGSENVKHVQKLSVKVGGAIQQFIKGHQEQAGSHKKCIYLHQMTVVFHQIYHCSEIKRSEYAQLSLSKQMP